jgi:hypothetical protein
MTPLNFLKIVFRNFVLLNAQNWSQQVSRLCTFNKKNVKNWVT